MTSQKNNNQKITFKYGSENFMQAFCLAFENIMHERHKMDKRHLKLIKTLGRDLKLLKKEVKRDGKHSYQLLIEKSEEILAVLIKK